MREEGKEFVLWGGEGRAGKAAMQHSGNMKCNSPATPHQTVVGIVRVKGPAVHPETSGAPGGVAVRVRVGHDGCRKNGKLRRRGGEGVR